MTKPKPLAKSRDYKVFGGLGEQGVSVSFHAREFIIKEMRRSDQLADKLNDLDEFSLLQYLAIELDTKRRKSVLERLYVRYKQVRERRERVALLTS